jgi:hypothetical protein
MNKLKILYNSTNIPNTISLTNGPSIHKVLNLKNCIPNILNLS